MKKLLLLVIIFMFVGVFAFAGQIDWGGSFTFRLGANPKDMGFDHSVPADFADVSADIEAQIDDNNLLHTSIGGISGSDDGVIIGDTYLKTDWGFMTTKLGNTAYDSPGYGVSNKEYELKTKGTGGPGVAIEVPIGNFTIGAGKFYDPCIGGIGVKYSNGIIDTLALTYHGDIINNDYDMIHTFTGGIKIVLDDFSSGAGIRIDDSVFAYGFGAKYSFSPAWIAAGVGIEAGEVKIGANTGFDLETWGHDFVVSYVEQIDEVNISAWYKPNVVKMTIGYDWKVDEDNEVFIEVSADF